MAASFWVLIILGLIGLFVFVKANPGFRYGKFWTTLVGVLIAFFIITAGYILTRPEVDVSTLNGVAGATKLYLSWLGNFFQNTAEITGNVVNTDWGVNKTK